VGGGVNTMSGERRMIGSSVGDAVGAGKRLAIGTVASNDFRMRNVGAGVGVITGGAIRSRVVSVGAGAVSRCCDVRRVLSVGGGASPMRGSFDPFASSSGTT